MYVLKRRNIAVVITAVILIALSTSVFAQECYRFRNTTLLTHYKKDVGFHLGGTDVKLDLY